MLQGDGRWVSGRSPGNSSRWRSGATWVCGATHKQSYFDIVMVGIVSALLALVVVIVLGTTFGSF